MRWIELGLAVIGALFLASMTFLVAWIAACGHARRQP